MKITTKEYVDTRIDDLLKLRQSDLDFFKAELAAEREAKNIYRITNDEWKILHNGLQRKMDEQTKSFITWPSLWAVIVGVASFVLGLAMLYKK